MTLGIQQKAEASRWEALMQAVEAPFAAAVRAEKDRYITAAIEAFPINLKLTDTAFDVHVTNMSGIAARYDAIAVRVGLDDALSGIKSVQRKSWESLWLFLLREWINNYGARAARETAQTTREDMQRVINLSLADTAEFNPVAVATRLLRVKDLSAWRAQTIARTEVHGAMMYASEEGAAKVARDNELVFLKSWLPVLDSRTRADHAAMSSHPAISMDADFNVGGLPMKRPGDPRGGAANCINCRCVLTFRVEE